MSWRRGNLPSADAVNNEPCSNQSHKLDSISKYTEQKRLALETLLLVEDDTVLALKSLSGDLLAKHSDDGDSCSGLSVALAWNVHQL